MGKGHLVSLDAQNRNIEIEAPTTNPRIPYYYEARNDYTNNLETILLCNRCVCNSKLIPREFSYVIGVYRTYHMEAPKSHKIIFLPEKALCNRCPV